MNLSRIDLNLLVYLDVLLRECNVTKAAHQLGITQPAMSNGLRRLRELFDDPLLVRTSEGMVPTERATELKPLVRNVLAGIEEAVQPRKELDPLSSERVFRIMANDYIETVLLSVVIERLRTEAPGVIFDIMTPSDVEFIDLEQGKVDMAINRFDELPQSFHQVTLWEDEFACIMSKKNPLSKKLDLEGYLAAQHVWVSKTGMGVGVGINPNDQQRLGWVDDALIKLERKRNIAVFTRHYEVAKLLAVNNDLIATVPRKAVELGLPSENLVVKTPPFEIPPFSLVMAWSPLLQQNPEHRWLRRMIQEVAKEITQ